MSGFNFIFDLAFSQYALVSTFAASANLLLLYLLFSKGLYSSAGRWFALLVLGITTSSIFEAFTFSSLYPQTADFWKSLEMPGWFFIGPFLLGFSLAYVNREKFFSNPFSRLILLTPPFIFWLLTWTTNTIIDHRAESYLKLSYGWLRSPGSLYWMPVALIAVCSFISLGVLISYRLRIRDSVKKRQAAIFILAILIPIIGSPIAHYLLPIFGIVLFPTSTLLSSVMSLIITFGILRHRLFELNPAVLATSIVKNMNEIVIVSNLNYFVEFANDTAAGTLGYQKEDLIGQELRKLFGEDWPVFQDRVIIPVRQGKTVGGVETDLISVDGEKIPVSFSVSALKDTEGKVTGVVFLANDIRKIRELFDVTSERNKLTTVVESINDGVLALDWEGRVTMINSAALAISGMRREEVVDKRFDEVMTVFEDKKKILAKDLLPSGKPRKENIVTQKKNLQIVTAPDKRLFANLTSSAVKSSRESGLGAIVVIHDLTKEKELEEMKIDFVSMAAHELRSPVTSIRGYLSVFLEENEKKLEPEQKMFLDRINFSTEQLASLIDNLLNVTRIERGVLTLNVKAEDWVENVGQVVEEMASRAKEKKLGLKFIKPKGLVPKVLADQLRINEVLTNLIGNSINYTAPGGKITIWLESDRQKIVTHIKDTGQGIPKGALPHLFKKFYRVSGEIEQGSKGTGLGLYISKVIVEMHRGKIWVESEVGKGSTFSFSLPVKQNGKEESPTRRR
jgi:two-component system phosphate regulon sensor histidine kinase PhoR